MSKLTSLDGWMMSLAAQRCAVLLDDGRTVRLIAWRPMRKRGSRPAAARIEYPNGNRATIKLNQIVAFDDGDGEMCPLPREEQ